MTRLTAKAVAAKSGIPERLVRGVLRQLGGGTEALDTMRDVCRGGADAGFCGFTYHVDTVGFFKRYRVDIRQLAEQQACDMGKNVSDMVAGFQCLAGRDLSELRRKAGYGEPKDYEQRQLLAEYLPSVNRCLYGGRMTDDDTNVANALAWYALEEVSRAACDE